MAHYKEHLVSKEVIDKMRRQSGHIEAVPLADFLSRRGNKPLGTLSNRQTNHWVDKLEVVIVQLKEQKELESIRDGVW